ncbi:MAG: hypothetical protein ACE5OP_13485 [Candidatus Glassbacteria bacterium]
MAESYRNYIGGEWVGAQSDDTFIEMVIERVKQLKQGCKCRIHRHRGY